MWEFDPAEHQTLRELFDAMHKDVWKVLFKAAEVPPPVTEDRGSAQSTPPIRQVFYVLQDAPSPNIFVKGI